MSVFPAGFLHRRRCRALAQSRRAQGRPPPDMILLHYTGMQTGEAALARLCDGRRAKCRRITWCSRTAASCNACRRRCAPGTPACRPGPATPTSIRARSASRSSIPATNSAIRDFPLRQIAAVISLCRSILTRRGPISADRILAHSDVAPARKQDPGEKFPWELLSESGIGHWVRAGAARSRRRRAQARRPRRQRDAAAARVARLRLRHRGNRRSMTTRRARWSPPSSAISARPASTASPTPRRC